MALEMVRRRGSEVGGSGGGGEYQGDEDEQNLRQEGPGRE